VPGIGIDIAEVKRFRNLSARFLKRVYTDEEIAYCKRSSRPEMRGRWPRRWPSG